MYLFGTAYTPASPCFEGSAVERAFHRSPSIKVYVTKLYIHRIVLPFYHQL
jgi:hypothetical protein